MKVGDERSTFVVRVRVFERTLYPDLPGVPLRAWGPVSRKVRKPFGPEGKFENPDLLSLTNSFIVSLSNILNFELECKCGKHNRTFEKQAPGPYIIRLIAFPYVQLCPVWSARHDTSYKV